MTQISPAHVTEMELEKKEEDFVETSHIAANRDSHPCAAPLTATGVEQLAFFKALWTYRKVVTICIAISAGAMLDGFGIVIVGSISGNTSFVESFGTVTDARGKIQLDAMHVSAWGAMSSVGQVIGMLTGGYTSDRFGRKFNMRVLCFTVAIAIILELTAKNWIFFLFARMFSGWSTGLMQTSLATYVSEITPARFRSAMLIFYAGWFAVGEVAAIGALQIVESNGLNWRNAFYSEIIFLGLFIPALLWVPESPWWYALRGRTEDARRSLTTLFGRVEGFNLQQSDEDMRYEVGMAVKLAEASAAQMFASLFKGTNLRRTIISASPAIFQQFNGISLYFQYFAYFFAISGSGDPFLAVIGIFLIQIFTGGISTFITDLVGRRPLLLGGGVVMAICNFIVAGIGSASGDGPTKSPQALIVLSCIWAFSFSISSGPLAGAYAGDTATPVLRAKTTAVALAMAASIGIVMAYTVPLMLSAQAANWGIKTGYFFGVLTTIGVVWIYVMIPETKNRSYAELDELFEARTATRDFARAKTSVHQQAAAASSA